MDETDAEEAAEEEKVEDAKESAGNAEEGKEVEVEEGKEVEVEKENEKGGKLGQKGKFFFSFSFPGIKGLRTALHTALCCVVGHSSILILRWDVYLSHYHHSINLNS